MAVISICLLFSAACFGLTLGYFLRDWSIRGAPDLALAVCAAGALLAFGFNVIALRRFCYRKDPNRWNDEDDA